MLLVHLAHIEPASVRAGEPLVSAACLPAPLGVGVDSVRGNRPPLLPGEGLFHGVDGAARANELLKNYINDEKRSMSIQNVIVRHTPESSVLPQTPEEKVVFDADTIERLGFIGVVRTLMGKSGTIDDIIDTCVHKRLHDYQKLHYPVSKRMSKKAYKETIRAISRR